MSIVVHTSGPESAPCIFKIEKSVQTFLALYICAIKTVELNQILLGDCERVLREFPPNSVDLIFTSPPYANARRGKYRGTRATRYVDWFLPKAEEFWRVLKPKGTFILNIKERAEDGERQTFVIDLIAELRDQGWLWTEEFVWHKRNSFPGKWKNRFRDGWERLLQFNKQKDFRMFQRAVMVPMGDWAKPRLKRLSDKDKEREHSTLNDFGVNLTRWINRQKAFPDNVVHLPDGSEALGLAAAIERAPEFATFLKRLERVPNLKSLLAPLKNREVVENVLAMFEERHVIENVLHLSTECANRGHSAVFPVALPRWFIQLFTRRGDVVLDPFAGSGTTAVAAIELDRNFIAIERKKKFVELARVRLKHAGDAKARRAAKSSKNGARRK